MPNVSEWITVAGAGGLVTADDFNNTVRDNFHGLYDKKDNEIKHYCGYCPGMTFDDSRGHCCACGGPRVEEVKLSLGDALDLSLMGGTRLM